VLRNFVQDSAAGLVQFCVAGSTCESAAVTEIRLCRPDEHSTILEIIKAAAVACRGVIPDDCWHEPYMPRRELEAEMAAGVMFWVYEIDDVLVGGIGIQRVLGCRPDQSCLRSSDEPASRRRRRIARTSAEHEHTAHAGWHMGGRHLGNPLLSATRV
jgi:hypothetical protein